MARKSLAVITGPTGIGKTGAALDLAERFGAEIVNADSVQVYRFMDIGSAKPSVEERARVRHHLIDVTAPDEDFDAARYRGLAAAAVDDIAGRGKRVIVAGGTGLYIKALLGGLFQAPPVSEEVRRVLKEETRRMGEAAMYERLVRVDPSSAERIHPNDVYRILRALEVFEQTGTPVSVLRRQHGFARTPYRFLLLGLAMDRTVLYERIDRRVDSMLEQGLVVEVEGLLDRGYGPELKSMQSIGYRHVTEYLSGRRSLDETAEKLKVDTRRFAKRQYTWFRAQPELVWTDSGNTDAIAAAVGRFFDAEDTPEPRGTDR